MRRILLFALTLALTCATGFAQHDYNASYFGIKSNGVTDNTASIQKAIDFISEKGGGTLSFYVGRYVTGAVALKSKVHIKLNEGAVIVGSPNIYAYKGQKGLFHASEQEDITISGKGVIDACGPELSAFVETQRRKGFLPEDLQVPAPLYFENCKGIVLQQFIIRHSATAPDLYRARDSDVRVDGCYSDTK